MAERFQPKLWAKTLGVAASLFLFSCGGANLEPEPENNLAACQDGKDNDLDNSPDCFDIECQPFCNTNPDPENCVGGVDEDQDGLTDCDDSDCDGNVACQQAENCANGTDDDGDGDIDCDDSGCAQNPQCTGNNGGQGGEGGGPATNCFDGQDNDNDGDANCDDTECVEECNAPPENCNNGIDDNGDGAVDCADGQCFNQGNCTPNGSEICDNGIDDNGDGLPDCSDFNCFNDPFCGGGGNLFEICDNGVDDNGDGLADCSDFFCLLDPASGCLPGPGECDVVQCITDLNCLFFDPCCLDPASFECTGIAPNEICAGGDDEDFDGLVDCQDPDCAADLGCTPEDCNDGVDNNGDAQVDCRDSQCTNSPDCVEICNDNQDNDNDGLTDCADAGCAGDPNCAPVGDGTCNAPFPAQSGVAISDNTINGIDNDFSEICDFNFGDGFADLIFVINSNTNTTFNANLTTSVDLGMYARTGCNDFTTEIACVDNSLTNEVLTGVPINANEPVFLSVDGFDAEGPFTLTVVVN